MSTRSEGGGPRLEDDESKYGLKEERPERWVR